MRLENSYQIALIVFSLLVAFGLGAFIYYETFPEYKSYQNAYRDLEKFRSTYTGESPPPFSSEIQQIVIPDKNNGPEVIDRCISCHVAGNLPHFSPTKIAHDAHGNPAYDQQGKPILVENEDYIFTKLDKEIDRLEKSLAKKDRARAKELRSLKKINIEGKEIQISKVLRSHPLIGRELQPFDYHPMETYGCTSCHSGNGRALVSKRAHGPVFDKDHVREFKGPVPQFTESDPENDPLFAFMYNGKPGHDLVFQTSPLLIGPLMESRCVQCHQAKQINLEGISTSTEPKVEKNSVASLDGMLKNYERGQELYISQACYPCHRIAGYSRGNVGPELSKIGLSYPWYVKESIVWPQADLVSSTMPNFKLDHEELSSLMTFLMAQRGNPKTISEINYETTIKDWEKGAKLPWEKPIKPTDVHNLDAGMTYYATQGCASCHKLKGFESNVGFSSEKEMQKVPSSLSKEKEWFHELVPEQVLGSELVGILTDHKEEIDQHIQEDIRNNAFLERLQQQFPKLIESFYSNFKFAARAKDAEYKKMMLQEKDANKREQIWNELQQWKARVHRVLMIYIQEYGFGRDICPRLHWSGIFRDDAWLMGHFHNPSAYTPRSSMPLFPFDDSKFYALNYMLHVLGKRNRDELHQIWKEQGFNPELAFQLQCASCHGDGRRGNGIISEWIYPLPKNLRNADFLNNLTKKKAIHAITYGIKGTPMPPWGEVIFNKDIGDATPVLSQQEIIQLVDWLYKGVPQQEISPKWEYNIEDAVKEIVSEKNVLNPLLVKLKIANDVSEDVDFYFHKVKNEADISDGFSFYINQRFYTPENIEEGQQFFVTNCAQCHGKNGDGTGLRADSMLEAKPRMFTNLPWLKSHDDLRLLRSIKYGVHGTSMNAWGDLTSAAQRVQLVIFIRNLAKDRIYQDELEKQLYEVFDSRELTINAFRMDEYRILMQLEEQRQLIANNAETLYDQVEQQTADPEKAAQTYFRELKLLAEVQKEKNKDHNLQELISSLKTQRDLYRELGLVIFSKNLDKSMIEDYFKILTAYPIDVSTKEGQLTITLNDNKVVELQNLVNQMTQQIDILIQSFDKKKDVIEAHIDDQERIEKFQKLKQQQGSLINLNTKILAQMAYAKQLREKTMDLYERYLQSTIKEKP